MFIIVYISIIKFQIHNLASNSMLETIIDATVHFAESLGYLGIFLMTFIEGTLIPIPAEITLIPAGYLVATGKFNLYLVLLCSILGTLLGVLFCYFIAYYYGRKFLIHYGKYFFLGPEKLKYVEKYFDNHGEISAFIGRILPGIKHVIAFPAGLAKMDLKKFCIYSFFGGAIWVTILVLIGYFLGNNEIEIKKYLIEIQYYLFGAIGIIIFIYVFIKYKRYKNK